MSPESSDHLKLILELVRDCSTQAILGFSAESIKVKPLLLVVVIELPPFNTIGCEMRWISLSKFLTYLIALFLIG